MITWHLALWLLAAGAFGLETLLLLLDIPGRHGVLIPAGLCCLVLGLLIQ